MLASWQGMKRPMSIPPPVTTTAALLELATTGQREAQGRLLEKCSKQLLARIRGHPLMGRIRHFSSAEDVAQDVAMRFMSSRTLEGFRDRDRGSLLRLLFTLVDRTMKDMARRQYALKRGGLPAAQSFDGAGPEPGQVQVVAHDPSPSSNAKLLEFDSILQKLLSKRAWAVWRLKACHEEDFASIGRKLGMTAAAARSLYNRAKKRILRYFADLDDAQ